MFVGIKNDKENSIIDYNVFYKELEPDETDKDRKNIDTLIAEQTEQFALFYKTQFEQELQIYKLVFKTCLETAIQSSQEMHVIFYMKDKNVLYKTRSVYESINLNTGWGSLLKYQDLGFEIESCENAAYFIISIYLPL